MLVCIRNTQTEGVMEDGDLKIDLAFKRVWYGHAVLVR
jgi:hypothetical protein